MQDVDVNKVKKDKSLFKMSTNWLFDEPIDFEHKQYVLLDFLKYCDKKIEKFEVYPLYTELSIHLANLQSISSDFKSIYFEKKIENVDDEILISELKYRPINISNETDFNEINEIIKFSGIKILNYFNIVKAIWTIIYDSISIKPIQENNLFDLGYFYFDKNGKRQVWKYQIQMSPKLTIDSKMVVIKLKESKTEIEVKDIIFEFDKTKKIPIFELKATYDFPMESSLLPAFKRKVLNYIIQKNVINTLKQNGI
jgi:hypothetical protein